MLTVARCQERALGLDSPTPELDLEILLEHCLQRSPIWLRLHGDYVLSEAEAESFEALYRRRVAGEPVAYLIGHWGFWSLDLEVSPETLIPRPDTELLVEVGLELGDAFASAYPEQSMQVVDLGTGTGAVALALARERPRWQVLATDRIHGAVALARRNAVRNGIASLEVRQGRWFEPPEDQQALALIVSNPPYIPLDDSHLHLGDVRFEPASALVAGNDGLDDIRLICAQAPAHLAPGGALALEHGFDQGAAVRAILTAAGFTRVQTRRDLGGQDRVSYGIWSA